MDLKEESILKESVHTHWYYLSKGLALRKFLKSEKKFKSVLDIGAGSGIFSRQLLRHTDIEESECIDIGYEEEREEFIDGKKISFKKGFTHSDADLVLLMDILEHLEDDSAFVKDLIGKVNPDTHFVITVPAFNFLFSGHDLFLEHFRRYNVSGLEKCLASAGLKIVKTRFFFSFLFPLVVILRFANKLKLKLIKSKRNMPKSELKKHSAIVNSILILINKMELLFFPLNRVCGLTIFSLAVKR